MPSSLWRLLGRLIYWIGGVIFLPVFVNGSKRTRVAPYDPKTRRILLVKSWIGAQKWDLPGGGIKKGESAIDCALRETFEETGITLKKAKCKSVGTIRITEHVATYSAEVFLAMTEETPPTGQPFEILDAQWFSVDNLPDNLRRNSIDMVMGVLQ